MSKNSDSTAAPSINLTQLRRMLLTRAVPLVLVIGGILFLSAGTFDYAEAWIWIAAWFIPLLFVVRHFYKNDPEFLMNRMKVKEKEKEQRSIQKYGSLFFLITFLIPGFDKRCDWSSVPFEIVVVSDVMVCIAYFIVVRVFMENRYASRVIEVQTDQKVVTTGPYAIVRHPMYAGSLLMFLFTPLALGSYWALINPLFYLIIILARIVNEEKVLKRELNGYEEYTHMVRYRLIPRVW